MPKQNNYRRRTRQQVATPEQEIVENFLQGLGQMISWSYKKLFHKGGARVSYSEAELQKLRDYWEQVEMHALQPATHIIAVSEADKILDSSFVLLGLPGESMADRLRAAESRFTPDQYQRIWEAHKLRNTLAHEVGAHVTPEETKKAVAIFRQALYDLRILQ